MSKHLNSFFFFGLVIFFLVLPLESFSQTTQQKSVPAQPTPQITFSQRINRSSQDLERSNIYFLSFKKSHEASYLTLAATHCAYAISTLKAAQMMFPNTTRFYYQAKNKRFSACQFYKKLKETASRLDPRYHIKDVSDNGCNF